MYSVLDENRKVCALKEVDLTNADEDTVSGYQNEIALLEKLQGSPYIIKMHGWEINKDESYIHIVMERGDVDLSTVLNNRRKAGKAVGENYIRMYWEQMLEAVHVIHEANVVHADLKPANFLVVAGTLKLIDFGIATAVEDDATSAIRDSAVGTLNYMAPEAISSQAALPSKGAKQMLKIGPATDVWSLGCILYSLAHGKRLS